MKNYDLHDLETQELTSFHEIIRISQQRSGSQAIDPDDFLVVNLLLDGEALCKIDNQEVLTKPNSITIIHPREAHQLALSASNTLGTLIYSPQYIKQFLTSLTKTHQFLLDNPDQTTSETLEFSQHFLINKWDSVELIKRVYEIMYMPEQSDLRLLQESYFHDALLSLMRNDFIQRMQQKQGQGKESPAVKDELKIRIQKAIEYIQSNYHEELTIDQLASVASMSKFHFTRIFKKITGLSPYQFLARKRIEQAQVLLRHTQTSITEIAFEVGFANPTSFYNFFMKEMGVSPSQYRKG